MRRYSLIAATVAMLATAVGSQAATLAYWNFEDGVAGQNVYQNTNFLTADASGNGNYLRTYNASTAANFQAVVPYTRTPSSNAVDNLSINFFNRSGGGTIDLYTGNNGEPNISNPVPSINTAVLNNFTIEAAVRFSDTDGFQTFMGKDGQNIGGTSPLSNMYFQLVNPGGADNGKVAFKTYDSTQTFQQVFTQSAVQANHWYAFAAVANGLTLSLYQKDLQVAGSSYVLQSTTSFTGGMYNQGNVWTVGRGFYGGNIGDQFRGNIDDIRIGNSALTTSQFLGSAPAVVPEGSTASLALLGIPALLGVVIARRRRK